jgi:PAS domain S-box-containing protein
MTRFNPGAEGAKETTAKQQVQMRRLRTAVEKFHHHTRHVTRFLKILNDLGYTTQTLRSSSPGMDHLIMIPAGYSVMISGKLFMSAEKLNPNSEPELKLCGLPFAKNSHPMWVFDRETLAFLDVNEAAVRKYGYSRAQFLAMTIADIRPEEDLPELLRATRAKDTTTGAAWRHRTRYGAVVQVAITSWELIFRGRPAELVLARWEDSR